MSEYLLSHGTRATPQSEPISSDQVENTAGGFVWEIDKWAQLNRFLILGSEGGTYYISEQKLTGMNIKSVRECIAEDGPRAVAVIASISDGGRAPKNDPALYALAAAISFGDKQTKRLAAEALPKVARIATHLYHFVAYAETMRGWGRTMRWAVSNWYARNPEQLAYQAVKYRQRDGWSHRDLLRLAHPSNATPEVAAIFDWIAHPEAVQAQFDRHHAPVIEGFLKAQNAKTPEQTAALVREYNLPREALLSDHLNDVEVWHALLEQGMPLHAMVRNLATMTRNGTLESREHRKLIVSALDERASIQKSRLHPMALLIGLRTYASGEGFRSSNTWTPIPDITDALDGAFYLAFDNVEPTGKRHLLALDVSGSMGGSYVAGSNLTAREASVAMALITLHSEKDVAIMGFTHGFVPLPISRKQRLDDAVASVSRLPFDSTDCSVPMRHALQEKWGIDAFVVYTDSETWFGGMHPTEALKQYRESSGIPAKEVVVGMEGNNFSIADPNDPGQLDVVGFDASAPAVIADFIRP